MSTTLADVDIGAAWEDVVATHATAESVDVRLQNVGAGLVSVVEAGGSPNGKTGTLLAPLDSVQVNAANLWVRSVEDSGRISVTLL